MIDAVIGNRYSLAIYEIAESLDKVKEIYENLNYVMEAYEKDKEFKNLIDHPLISEKDKKEFLTKLFSKKFEKMSMDVLYYLIEKNRIAYIKNIVAEYLKIYYERHNYTEVEATFALELTKEQKAKLMKKLEKMTGKKVELSVKIDKSIIGGGIIKIGNRIIDGSLKRQFEMIKSGI